MQYIIVAQVNSKVKIFFLLFLFFYKMMCIFLLHSGSFCDKMTFIDARRDASGKKRGRNEHEQSER